MMIPICPTVETMAELAALIDEVEARPAGELTDFLAATLYRHIVTVDDVLQAAQACLAVSVPTICGRRRATKIAEARAITVLVAQAITGTMPLVELAEALGRDRSTVAHMLADAREAFRHSDDFAEKATAVRRAAQGIALARLRAGAKAEAVAC
jgi:chromosomal replication initiation ATPase DnaA